MELSNEGYDFAPECTAGVTRHAVREHVHSVLQGYWLLKACQKYAVSAPEKGARGGLAKAQNLVIPKVGITSPAAINPIGVDSERTAPEGFNLWLEQWIYGPRIMSRGTVYNRMRAAQQCGITADMSEAEAEALAAAKMEELRAAGMKGISALYELDDGTDEEKAKRRQMPVKEETTLVQGLLKFMEKEFCPMFAPQSKHLKAMGRLPVAKIQEQRDHLQAAIDQIDGVLALKGVRQ